MQITGPFGIGEQNDLALARRHLLHVGHGLLEYPVMRRDDDHRHGFIDQRNRSVLELARGITFCVDIGNFFELESPLERKRKAGAAAEIKHVAAFGEIAREMLNLGLERERLRPYAWRVAQRPAPLALPL